MKELRAVLQAGGIPNPEQLSALALKLSETPSRVRLALLSAHMHCRLTTT